jgi:2-phosphosulfolactate phosphatase
VTPSPNGATIAASVEGVVVAACLRNAAAVGGWLRREGFGVAGRPLTVIAAGERWPDGTLRPAVEDLVGAGAVIASLGRCSTRCSPEAAIAVAAFRAAAGSLAAILGDSASGRELSEAGYGDDVRVAAALNVDDVVPGLRDGRFTDVRGPTARA